MAANAMNKAMAILKPHFAAEGIPSRGIMILGTVAGDLHEIGKNVVRMVLEGDGWQVIDLGVDVSPQAFVDAAHEGVQIIGMSALLTTTMSNMGNTIEALKAAGVREKVKVMIGGAPVTQEFANSIGADAFAADAPSAARIARQLLA